MATAKLLHDFIEPATPTPVSRRVTFTGRVTDVPDDTATFMYRETEDTWVVHPRDGVQRWKAGERRIYSHLRDMQQWLEVNIAAYMNTAQHWQPEVYPRRFLYAHGMRGSGRLTLLADFCCKHRINLLVVRRNENTKDALFAVYEKAAQMEPCVVYINNATSILGSSTFTNELIAAYAKGVYALSMNVWTVLAGSFAPKSLLVHTQQSAHPIFSKLLEPSGDIVHVPCVSDIDETSRMAIDFLREVAQDDTIVPSDYRHTPWSGVVDHMARAFIFHTGQEMRRFIRDIFSRHNSRCASSGESISLPSPGVFDAVLRRLVRVESCGQIHYKLFSRNSYQDHARQLEGWQAYLAIAGTEEPPALFQYTYTPSIDREYEPVSVSSPARPAESLLPQCAPTKRTTKRAREATRPPDTISEKPLPTLPQRPMDVMSFFDDF